MSAFTSSEPLLMESSMSSVLGDQGGYSIVSTLEGLSDTATTADTTSSDGTVVSSGTGTSDTTTTDQDATTSSADPTTDTLSADVGVDTTGDSAPATDQAQSQQTTDDHVTDSVSQPVQTAPTDSSYTPDSTDAPQDQTVTQPTAFNLQSSPALVFDVQSLTLSQVLEHSSGDTTGHRISEVAKLASSLESQESVTFDMGEIRFSQLVS
jgi:hypothetical protein